MLRACQWLIAGEGIERVTARMTADWLGAVSALCAMRRPMSRSLGTACGKVRIAWPLEEFPPSGPGPGPGPDTAADVSAETRLAPPIPATVCVHTRADTMGGIDMATPAITDTGRLRMTAIIRGIASEAARHVLEAMMTTSEYQKTFIERIHDQGIAEGKAEAVLRLLDARGLAPSPEQRQLVTSSTDPAQLDLWFDRAITASTAEDVFTGPR